MNWKISAKDLIVMIEFVCVEACKGAREPGGSWLGKQTSIYNILDNFFLSFLANECICDMNLSDDVGRNNRRHFVGFMLW